MSQILRHYLTKEGRVRRLFYCLIRTKERCIRKFEGLTRSKILGILQTVISQFLSGGDALWPLMNVDLNIKITSRLLSNFKELCYYFTRPRVVALNKTLTIIMTSFMFET